MLNILKNAYCFYVVELLLKCNCDQELNIILDRVIDQDCSEEFVKGDADIKGVFYYVIEYRKYNRCLITEKPQISYKIILKVLAKSFF